MEDCPTDGTEFAVWFARDCQYGDWEGKCRIGMHGALEIYGRIDYDQDGWEAYSGDWHATHFMIIDPPHKEPTE